MFIANEWFVNFDIDVIELSSLYFNLNKNNQGNPYCVLIYHNLKCVQSLISLIYQINIVLLHVQTILLLKWRDVEYRPTSIDPEQRKSQLKIKLNLFESGLAKQYQSAKSQSLSIPDPCFI